ncbi:hypothetical protein A1O1_03716 [Capronia coronata CBS 617.96]|uniref:Altered inheritance of mitochondria protein 41 n=1 Tax=Capronia coronata CBS 617.96 TaxID=1182541 RepID=W9YDJ9_9EURO|nr:uncharacterized protein A1O1_03716 [Capronia coronata CBS 617.96]EXJ90613.1 hypothetical protein A1O1_03716 [Capronia coronata CBS 617.96]
MATAPMARTLFVGERNICARCLRRGAAQGLRWNSSSSTAPSALFSKIKGDLKAAMRAKDTARLSVLRGTISEINQAASGTNPIKTDMQILALLRKRKAASEAAAKEAQEAGRPELVEKQEKEVAVVDELVGAVNIMGASEMRTIVRSTIQALKGTAPGELKLGVVLKELLKPDGQLADQLLDKKVLAELVKEELTSKQDRP